MDKRQCSCGCGETISRERFDKRFSKSYVSGHQFRGKLNHSWKNGRYKASGNNYVFLLEPNHPNADKRGYVREHVYVMSKHLGRAIASYEVVHHINGIPDDNRIENLVCLKRSKHHSLHHKGLIKPNSLKALREHRFNRAHHTLA